MTPSFWVALAVGAFTILGAIITFIIYGVKASWFLSKEVIRVDNDAKVYTDRKADELVAQLAKRIDAAMHEAQLSRQEGLDGREIIRKETGELGHSLRTKIHELETWSRDHFVNEKDFGQMIARFDTAIEGIKGAMEKMTDKLGDRMEKMAERFESKMDEARKAEPKAVK